MFILYVVSSHQLCNTVAITAPWTPLSPSRDRGLRWGLLFFKPGASHAL